MPLARTHTSPGYFIVHTPQPYKHGQQLRVKWKLQSESVCDAMRCSIKHVAGCRQCTYTEK